jgi:hypothetical protein
VSLIASQYLLFQSLALMPCLLAYSPALTWWFAVVQ